MEALLGAISVLLLTVVTLLLSLYGARRLGLTDAQKVRRSEEAATLDALRTRLGIVEADARDLRTRVGDLEAQVASRDATIARHQATITAQTAELAMLHELISDGALDALREALARRPASRRSPRVEPS